jgi:uncharacterized lipoprotein YmbA
LAIAVVAAGCSTPPSRLYTLSRAPAAPAASAAAPLPNITVVVGPVSIPGIVDQPQFVVNTGANSVSIDEFNRWASPLQGNISRVVAENLVMLLGTQRVSQFQQSLNLDADFRVAIEVQSFESAPGEAATLKMPFGLYAGPRTASRRRADYRARADGFRRYDAIAAAHSRALAKMSQEIADAIRGLERVAQ